MLAILLAFCLQLDPYVTKTECSHYFMDTTSEVINAFYHCMKGPAAVATFVLPYSYVCSSVELWNCEEDICAEYACEDDNWIDYPYYFNCETDVCFSDLWQRPWCDGNPHSTYDYCHDLCHTVAYEENADKEILYSLIKNTRTMITCRIFSYEPDTDSVDLKSFQTIQNMYPNIEYNR
jgi:hypothetical protein